MWSGKPKDVEAKDHGSIVILEEKATVRLRIINFKKLTETN